MSTPIRFVIYTAIFLLIGAVIYFFAFWRPNANRVEQLHIEIDAARAELMLAAQRDEIHPQVRADAERLREEHNREQSNWEYISQDWENNYGRFMPEVFDDDEMRHRIHNIVYPHAGAFHVEFLYSQPLGMMRYNESSPNGPPEGVWLTPVDVNFSVNFNGLVEILRGFANAGIDNRILEYDLTRHYEQWNVRLRLEILTQRPAYHRYNGDYAVYSYDD